MNPHHRRNTLIRTVAAVAGDLAIGVAVACACSWLIESAALGLFLGFLIWIAGVLAALALSQTVVHPTVQFVLSDHKLDQMLSAAQAFSPVWDGAVGAAASLLRRT